MQKVKILVFYLYKIEHDDEKVRTLTLFWVFFYKIFSVFWIRYNNAISKIYVTLWILEPFNSYKKSRISKCNGPPVVFSNCNLRIFSSMFKFIKIKNFFRRYTVAAIQEVSSLVQSASNSNKKFKTGLLDICRTS